MGGTGLIFVSLILLFRKDISWLNYLLKPLFHPLGCCNIHHFLTDTPTFLLHFPALALILSLKQLTPNP